MRAAPYITPQIVQNAPTGISWTTIPDFGSSPAAQYAEALNICWRATHFIDGYCNQVLRATQDTEELLGPTYRLTVDGYNTNTARFIVSRWPVTSVVKARWCATGAVPNNWTTIPLTAIWIEDPNFVSRGISASGAAGAQAIRISQGYITWWGGRNAFRLQLTYVNGWAHTALAATATAGATTITVTDCSGTMVWNATNKLEGVNLWIYDGADTELVSVESASASYGPGKLTLASPLSFKHTVTAQRLVLVSALPEDIQDAGILHATYQALVRGATATTVQAMPGSEAGGGGGHDTTLLDDVRTLLDPYRRTI